MMDRTGWHWSGPTVITDSLQALRPSVAISNSGHQSARLIEMNANVSSEVRTGQMIFSMIQKYPLPDNTKIHAFCVADKS